MAFDTLAARQSVADAARARTKFADVPRPEGLDATELIVAASIVELLAERAGEPPPSWTASVGPSALPIVLVRAAEQMPRLRRLCETDGPLALRRRGVVAPPDFLTFA